MSDDNVRNYWLGFIVAVVGVTWLIWLWRKQREVMPRPLVVSSRAEPYSMQKTVEPVKPETPDDLESIQGIGPAYARRLNDAGILTFAELAKADPDNLRQITATTRWDPQNWIDEARSFMAEG